MIKQSLNIRPAKMLASDLTIDVPTDFSTINSAIDYLKYSNQFERYGGYATIKVADGTYTYTSPISNDNFIGQNRLNIIGNTSDCTLCTLKFNNSHGVYLRYGQYLYNFDGFQLYGNKTTYDGFIILGNAGINIGASIHIRSFGRGINVAQNSLAILGNYVLIQDNTSHGIGVYHGSRIAAARVISRNNGGYGMGNSYGSYINAPYCTIQYNSSDGINSIYSVAVLNNSSITNNSGSGVTANTCSHILLTAASVQNNTVYDCYALNGAFIDSSTATVTNNGTNFNPTKGAVGNNNAYIL